MSGLFDELRGAVIDLPVGTILPGWVAKDAVIAMLDRIEAERALATQPEGGLRAAAGRVLDCFGGYDRGYWQTEDHDALADLRAALAQPEPLDVDRLARAIAVVWSVGHPDLRSGLTEGGFELAAAIAAEYAEPDRYDE